MKTNRRVVVVGGGLAGTTAALDLACRGWDTTLLESRRKLGGAVRSFRRSTEAGELDVDTGQHVFLRCYGEYLTLLYQLGVAHQAPLQPRMDIPVLRPARRMVRLRSTGRLPAPAHLVPSLLHYDALTVRERLRAAATMAALRHVDPDDPRTDEQTFGRWLRSRGETDASIEALWGLIAVAALNLPVDDASLALAARVFRTALLERPDAADVGLPAVPLSDLHDVAARARLRAVGARCVTGERVRGIEPVDAAGGGFTVRTDTGEAMADAVVVATPHGQATALVPAAACPDRSAWDRLGSTPIVNVHVRYERPVTSLPFAAAVGSPVQWVFDRTRSGEPGQHLAVSLSAADQVLGMPAGELVARYERALAELFPAARATAVLDAFVTREPQATFRQTAGTGVVRPPTRTRLPGLVLAGAWTATGWPDTMEGAVRSGRAAARALAGPGPQTIGRRQEQPERQLVDQPENQPESQRALT
jgi:squalene-associated FAD-dependent desaturase